MSTISVGQQAIDALTKSLFQTAKIDAYKFRSLGKESIPQEYDHFIAPIIISKEEKETKSGLLNAVLTNVEAFSTIQPLSIDLLESAIVLEAPRQAREYSQSQASETKSKGRGRRSSAGNGGTATKRGLGDTDIAQTSKGADAKRAKTDPATILSESNIKELALKTATKFSNHLPINFYEVIDRLFDEFWNLQFDDTATNFAFFANITVYNCRDYGLTTFAEHSYSLGVIKGKLQSHEYLSIDDFLHDFAQLFANILKYYPEHHNAYQKALELRQLFDQRWSEYITQFQWRK